MDLEALCVWKICACFGIFLLFFLNDLFVGYITLFLTFQHGIQFDRWIVLSIGSSILSIVYYAICHFKFKLGVEMQKLKNVKEKGFYFV